MSKKVIVDGNQITIKVSEEIRTLVESLFWVLQIVPDNIAITSTSNSYTIFNLEKDKRLDIEVEKHIHY